MAKATPKRSARKPQERDYHSVLLRSAESLGRMIGALQRQIDRVTRHLPTTDGSSNGNEARAKNGARKNGGVKKKRAARKPAEDAGSKKAVRSR